MQIGYNAAKSSFEIIITPYTAHPHTYTTQNRYLTLIPCLCSQIEFESIEIGFGIIIIVNLLFFCDCLSYSLKFLFLYLLFDSFLDKYLRIQLKKKKQIQNYNMLSLVSFASTYYYDNNYVMCSNQRFQWNIFASHIFCQFLLRYIHLKYMKGFRIQICIFLPFFLEKQ